MSHLFNYTNKKDLFLFVRYIVFSFLLIASVLCSCHHGKTESFQHHVLTKEKAYEGVSNYCHSEYDWSIANDNPSIMYLQLGEETDTAYHVVFRSYTGAFVHFYVNKTNGKTRMVESVPALHVEEEKGAIDLFDYLEEAR